MYNKLSKKPILNTIAFFIVAVQILNFAFVFNYILNLKIDIYLIYENICYDDNLCFIILLVLIVKSIFKLVNYSFLMIKAYKILIINNFLILDFIINLLSDICSLFMIIFYFYDSALDNYIILNITSLFTVIEDFLTYHNFLTIYKM